MTSHRTAAVLHALLPDDGGTVHVTLIASDRRPTGIKIHRRASIEAEERAEPLGIPSTSPARTLADLRATAPLREYARALNDAQVLGLVDAGEGEPTFTRSEAERRAVELIAAAGLPRPASNVRVGGFEVDLLWREERVIVEIDGYAYHRTRAAFERDRRKTARLQALGYLVIRVTWRWLTAEPHALVADLATALATRRPPPASCAARARGA